ncbi:MAG: DUF484 family protein [Pseudomonadota bacterium]
MTVLTSNATETISLREMILREPELVLDDPDVMRALITSNENALGGNIVDLRGVAMERLETRLARLEDTHRSVIAAAYENLAGTNQIHRAILRMLDPIDFEDFLSDLGGEVADIMRVDAVRLLLESGEGGDDPALARVGDVLMVTGTGFIHGYLTGGRQVPVRQVTLRQVQGDAGGIYGDGGDWIRSEACLKLDFGPDRQIGMLALGSEDPHHFAPAQGADLLAFFAGVFERSMRRWLA